MNKIKRIGMVAVLTLALSLGAGGAVAVPDAGATVTFSADEVGGSGALALTGATASIWSTVAGNLTIEAGTGTAGILKLISDKTSTANAIDIDSVGGVDIDVSAGGLTIDTVTGDIKLDATDKSVVIDGGEADAAAVSIDASHADGGITVESGTLGMIVNTTVTTENAIDINPTAITDGDVINIVSTTLEDGAFIDMTVPASRIDGSAIKIADASVGGTVNGDLIQIDVSGTPDTNTVDIDFIGVATGNAVDVTYATDAATGNAVDLNMGTNLAGMAISINTAATGTSGEGAALDISHATGSLTGGADLVRIHSTASPSATSHLLAIEQDTGAGNAGAYGLYINTTGTSVEAIKVDAGNVVFDENLTVSGTVDAESYMAVGNGSALSADSGLIVDYDATYTGVGQQLLVKGTVTGAADTNVYGVAITPESITTPATGTNAVVASLYVKEPIITKGAAALTAATTVYIEDAPSEGTGNYALWVDAGTTKLDGTVTITAGALTDASVEEDDLAASLAFDNADLVSFASVSVDSATEGLILPQHATSCGTHGITEGQVCWQADTDTLYIGDGSGVTQAIGNVSGDNTWTGFNVFAPTDVTDVVTIGKVDQTGTITLGLSTAGQTIDIGSAAVGTGKTQNINIGNGATAATQNVSIASGNAIAGTDTVTIGGGSSATSGGKVVNIANGVPGASTTNTVAIGTAGTDAGVVGITIGSNGNDVHTTAIQGGTGTSAITLTPAAAGEIVIGKSDGTGDITVGESTAAQTVNIGSGAAGATAQVVNIGTGIASTGSKDVNIATSATSGVGTTTVSIADGANKGVTTVNIANTALAANVAKAVNIAGGNDAGASTVSIGNGDKTGTNTIDIGTGINDQAISIGSGATAAGKTDTINIGTGNNAGTGNKVIHIGDGTPAGTGLTTVAIGNAGGNSVSTVTIEAGTSATALQIGNGATAHGIKIGTGAAAQTLVIGSGNTTSTLTLQAGTDNTTGGITINGAINGASPLVFDGATVNEHELTLAITDPTGDVTVTFPDATDTLVGKATTDTFTNKSFDCDGTSNALTNVNGDEVDPIAATNGTYTIPMTIVAVNAGSTDVTVIASTPFKARIIDAWAVSTKGSNSGTWKLTDGTDDITTALAYGTGDNDIARAAEIIDAKHDLAGSGALHLISTEVTDTAIVYISVIRVD